MPAKTLSFRMGDVFKPDDDLSIWLCTIALAYNDLIITMRRFKEAENEWERFYDWRVGVGHYSEIMSFLARMRERRAIKTFFSNSPSDLAAKRLVEQAFAGLGDAVAAFMDFANQAQDEFFLRRQPEGTVEFRIKKS